MVSITITCITHWNINDLFRYKMNRIHVHWMTWNQCIWMQFILGYVQVSSIHAATKHISHQHLFHMHGSACVQQLRPACTNSDKPSLCWLLSSSYASQADCERRSINKLICGDNYCSSPSQNLLSTRWKQQGTINPQQPICKCKISQKHVNDSFF